MIAQDTSLGDTVRMEVDMNRLPWFGSVTDASLIVGIPVAAIVDSAEELIGAQDTFAIDD